MFVKDQFDKIPLYRLVRMQDQQVAVLWEGYDLAAFMDVTDRQETGVRVWQVYDDEIRDWIACHDPREHMGV